MADDEDAGVAPWDCRGLGLEPAPDVVGVPEGQGRRPETPAVSASFHQIMHAGFDPSSPFR